MASVKTTAILTAGVLVLASLGVGGTYLWMRVKDKGIQQDLQLAESYLTQGKPAEAQRTLEVRMANVPPGASWLPQALALQFKTLAALNDSAAQKALAAKVLEGDAPLAPAGSEAWARAQTILGNAAIEAQNAEEAKKHFDLLLAQPAGTYGRDFAELGLARIEMASGKVPAARDRLAAMLETLPADAPARKSVEDNLGRCNMALLRQPPPEGGDYEIYTIQPRDTLDSLRKRFNVSPELLMSINGITDARRLTIGRRLIVPKLNLAIVVDKSKNTLTLLNGGKFFKRYDVRTGEFDYMTPVGDFTIQNKKVDPVWNNPKDNRTYPAGDPANQLGSRWMGFQGNNLGIHEAIDISTIGSYSSNGCVGLKKEDVQELFNLVPVGTPVKITGTISTPSTITLN